MSNHQAHRFTRLRRCRLTRITMAVVVVLSVDIGHGRGEDRSLVMGPSGWRCRRPAEARRLRWHLNAGGSLRRLHGIAFAGGISVIKTPFAYARRCAAPLPKPKVTGSKVTAHGRDKGIRSARRCDWGQGNSPVPLATMQLLPLSSSSIVARVQLRSNAQEPRPLSAACAVLCAGRYAPSWQSSPESTSVMKC